MPIHKLVKLVLLVFPLMLNGIPSSCLGEGRDANSAFSCCLVANPATHSKIVAKALSGRKNTVTLDGRIVAEWVNVEKPSLAFSILEAPSPNQNNSFIVRETRGGKQLLVIISSNSIDLNDVRKMTAVGQDQFGKPGIYFELNDESGRPKLFTLTQKHLPSNNLVHHLALIVREKVQCLPEIRTVVSSHVAIFVSDTNRVELLLEMLRGNNERSNGTGVVSEKLPDESE